MKVDKQHVAIQVMSRVGLKNMIKYYEDNFNEESRPNFSLYAEAYKLRLEDLNKNNYKFYYVSKKAQERYATIDFKKFFDNESWFESFIRLYSGVIISEEYTCFYTISNKEKLALTLHVLSNDTSNGLFTFATCIIPKDCIYLISSIDEKKGYSHKVFPLDALPDDQRVVMEKFLRMLFFIEFAEVKIVEVNPKNLKYGCKGHWKSEIFNEADIKIKVVDIGWDTTIKTGAFTVQGHFRWQRFGEANSKKKLIWIDEFEKDGYTKLAGKLME